MKHLIFFSVSFILFFSLPNVSLAQNNNGIDPPLRAKANFNAKYPDYNGTTKWNATTEGYQATFRQNNKEIESTFDEEGRWLRSRTEVKENELPNAAKQYIKDVYAPYKYLNGFRYENKDALRYEVEITSENEKKRLEFNKDGGFIQEK